ncbi:MAG: leucine--tRNA ligase [Clostridia bacterium]|jgi:leucyl-tRNA synthetase|nr:leucine--tRNA ligase [Clostridia bacterium]
MNIEKIKQIEKFAKDKWERERLSAFDHSKMGKKLYVMDMFSYPSGAKLHLGHWFNFGLVDSYARFKKMQGFNVFQPMGFDAFGLPAENYAIKTGTHPYDSTMKNIEVMRGQLKEMGGMFDWSNEVVTCDPEYYKWTQWVFCELYKRGLAYKKAAPANWCPSCQTVLAREQVKQGKCERCGSDVHIKNMNQWFLKITDYAEELLTGLDGLDWPEKTKAMQRNWIGKSEGSSVIFKNDVVGDLEIFTTRPDTVFGVTYIVMAPEHELVNKLVTAEHAEEVEAYVRNTERMTEIERQSTSHEKTGVFTGSYAENPVTGKKVQIWISDYVLESYGTGIVMAVPAHDDRDYEFATKYGLEIVPVIDAFEPDNHCAYTGEGKMINSAFLDGMSVEEAKSAIVDYLSINGVGGKKVTYRLRDWLISRQRYWGAPIPIIYCDDCGEVLVPDEQLPVLLPYDVDFKPDGESPLARCESFVKTVCPCCGKEARREVDTMDTFMCSSWYMLRYPDARNDKQAFDPDFINQMLPVDKYVGGAEHSCMHLIYARFVTKVLRDAGYLKFDEPFTSLVHQGTILGPDGQKMSKSKGNTVSPDEYIDKFGSDVFRTYLMFGFNYTEGGPWSESGIASIQKYYDRVDRIFEKYLRIEKLEDICEDEEIKLLIAVNSTIDKITNGLDTFQFNTTIARMMELFSNIRSYLDTGRNSKILIDVMENVTKLMAPEAPHLAEYYWESLGHTCSIFKEKWPEVDEKIGMYANINIPVQINSKNITVLNVKKDISEEEIQKMAMDYVNAKLNGCEIKKVIFVPNRIINFVVK